MQGKLSAAFLAATALAALLAFAAPGQTAGPANSHPPPQPVVSWETFVHRISPRAVTKVACCKVCRKGKACGDSCISRDKNCNVGAGCACDG